MTAVKIVILAKVSLIPKCDVTLKKQNLESFNKGFILFSIYHIRVNKKILITFEGVT